jgi:hypothetical protein
LQGIEKGAKIEDIRGADAIDLPAARSAGGIDD